MTASLSKDLRTKHGVSYEPDFQMCSSLLFSAFFMVWLRAVLESEGADTQHVGAGVGWMVELWCAASHVKGAIHLLASVAGSGMGATWGKDFLPTDGFAPRSRAARNRSCVQHLRPAHHGSFPQQQI